MECLRITVRPLSAFGGFIKGDTLFGQLCWAARNRWGGERLAELLAGYTDGRPFAVCSDAFPAGHLPRPALPLHRFDALPEEDRKAVKRRRWLPRAAVAEPVHRWLSACRSDRQVLKALGDSDRDTLSETHAQPHNSINRLSGTTGRGAFAPYTLTQYWFAAAMRLECYLLVDSNRLSGEDASTLLADIGLSGYGRDASIGLGKFSVEQIEPERLPRQPDANACFTLAPVAPQGLALDPQRSSYQVFTRFGRHGDRAVLTGRPFKAPVLMADTGAVLSPRKWPTDSWMGQGLGGDGSLSNALPETVQQGYAPVVAIRLPEDEE
jgi:CRISPR-associated protein Csm4